MHSLSTRTADDPRRDARPPRRRDSTRARVRGAAAACVLCLLLAPQILSAPATWKSARPQVSAVESDLPGCVVSPENSGRENQTRAATRLSFKKGKPFVAAEDVSPTLSGRFRADAGLASAASATDAARRVRERLVKRLNYTLARLRFFDQIAREPLFQNVAPEEPEDPGEDASDEEKEEYRTALQAYNEKRALIDRLAAALNRAIDGLDSTRKARAFEGPWGEFFRDSDEDARDGPFERWRREVMTSESVQSAFRQLWQNAETAAPDFFVLEGRDAQANFYQSTSEASVEGDTKNSFFLFPDLSEEAGVASFGTGELCFRVSDPVNVGRDGVRPNYAVAPPELAGAVRRALRDAGLVGVPWSPEEVGPAIVSYFESRGYAVSPLPNPVYTERKVDVLRQRVEVIRLPQMSDEEAFRVLQRVLPRSAFEALVKNETGAGATKLLARTESAGEGVPAQILLRLRRESDEPDPERLTVPDDFIFIDQFTLARVGAALGRIDYGLTPQSLGDDRDNLFTRVHLLAVKLAEKREPAADSSEGRPAATPSPTPADARPVADASPTPSPSPTPARGQAGGALDSFLSATLFKVCPRFHNLFYAGALWRPRQGERVAGGYKCLRAGPGDAGFEAGEDGDPIGSLSYSTVIPFFGTGARGMFRRPLTLAFEAENQYEQKRLFGGVETDERRRGGSLRATLPLRAPSEPRQLDLSATVRRQSVTLAAGEHVLSKQNLTTLDLGARFFADRRTRPRPDTFELLSNLRLGLGLADGEQGFAHFSATASLHRELTYTLVTDLRARLGLASRDTPAFERPSFGAPDTVRGFTRDDAVGLRMWSVQPEVWLRGRAFVAPSPDPSTGKEGALRSLLRDSFYLAVFYDVGGVYRTLNSPPGARAGPGGGIRFTYNRQATIKLDWAYGVGERADGRRRLRFYLTFELPENPL